MGLWNRLLQTDMGQGETSIPIDYFVPALRELQRGRLLEAELKTAFDITGGQVSEWEGIRDRVNMIQMVGGDGPGELRDIMCLAEADGFPSYDSIALVKARFGVA